MFNRILALSAGSLLIIRLAFAAELPLLKIASVVRDEGPRGTIPTGAEDIAGLIAGDPSVRVSVESLFVLLPQHSEPSLCARVVSRDGLYGIAFGYDVRGAAPGEHRIEFRSKYNGKLGGLNADQLGVSLWLDNACHWNMPSDPVRVVASWRPHADLSKVILFVNSRGLKGKLFDKTLPPPDEVRACAPLSAPGMSTDSQGVSFNMKCEYALSNRADYSFEFQTYHFSTPEDHTPIRLRLP